MSEAAFPRAHPRIPADCDYDPGLTKRQYIAIAAMQGELAGSAGTSRPDAKQLVEYAFEIADAMIKAGEE